MEIRATLNYNGYTKRGSVKISFPLRDDQYKNALCSLLEIGAGDTMDRDCAVERISDPCQALKRLRARRPTLTSWTTLPDVWTASTMVR